MKAKHLFEEQSNITPFLNFIDFINRNSSKFVNNKPPVPIYRGMQREIDYAEKKIRQDRMPSDSNWFETHVFNYCFERAFGYADIRNKAVFCTFDVHRTQVYGPAHFIFPKNDSVYAIAKGHGDSIRFIRHEMATPQFKELQKNIGKEMLYKQTKSLDSYFGSSQQEMGNLFKQYLDEEVVPVFKNYFEVTKNPDDLVKYIDKDNELMIFNSSSYYVISVENAQNITGQMKIYDTYSDLIDVIQQGF